MVVRQADQRVSKGPSKYGLALGGLVLAMGLIVVGSLIAGRRDEQLSQIYGRRRGVEAVRSVNGTAVLAELFRRNGHRVTTLGRLSPRLNGADVLVWAPDDFGPPSKEQRDFLEKWLGRDDKKKKTLVYVGRDYDGAVAYWRDWKRLSGEMPARTQDEGLRRESEARAQFEAARSRMPTASKEKDNYARWFTMERDGQPRRAQSLSGPWAKDIDAAKTEIFLEGRLAIPTQADRPNKDSPALPANFDALLESEGDALVTRVTNDVKKDGWGDSQIIVIANGSFVLNYPLVNPEHRKLAAKLIKECGPAGRTVFIESGAGGPPVLDKEPLGGPPSALELLKVWPLNAILVHLAVLSILLCLARSPIFGRPHELAGDSPADFGKHVTALGRLLARTKDRNYAQARLAQYRQVAQRRSGRSHLKLPGAR